MSPILTIIAANARRARLAEQEAQASREWLAAKNHGDLDSVVLDAYIKQESLNASPSPMIGDRYSNR